MELFKAILLTLLAWVMPLCCVAAKDEPASHKLMQQWIALEQQKGTMLEEFQKSKDALELQLSLLELEEKSLQQLVDKLDTNTDEVEQERLQLIERQNQLEQEQSSLLEWLTYAVGELTSLSCKSLDLI